LTHLEWPARPRWIVVENVISMQRWDAYKAWLAQLRAVGYQLQEVKLDARNFGVAQARRRLFVVCDRHHTPMTPAHRRRKPVAVESVLRRRRSSDDYNYNFQPLVKQGRAQATLQRARRAIAALGTKRRFLIVYYGSDAAGGWQTVDRPLRTITTLDRFALVVANEDGHEMRMLQPPELAAAMGFPRNYKWPKTTRREHIKLIGNAVSPPVMQGVVKSLTSDNGHVD
jgi:DNA (cytosine-5)-methyltransferase 1